MSVDLQEVLRYFAEAQKNAKQRAVSGFPSLHPIMRLKNIIDRRRASRVRQNVQVIVETDTNAHPAVLCDISEGGLGLRNIDKLGVGDYISILIGRSITVRGVVVWQKDDRTGVRFIGEH